MLPPIRLAPRIVAGGAALASLAALAPVGAAAGPRGPAAGRPAARIASGTRIQLRNTNRGKLLTTGGGLVLFVFSRDSRNVNRCAAVPSCASIWAIQATNGRPAAGPGVKRSLLGTIHVRGKAQVTYAGHPLYRYTPEPVPGATDYVGANQSGGIWRAIRASGAVVG